MDRRSFIGTVAAGALWTTVGIGGAEDGRRLENEFSKKITADESPLTAEQIARANRELAERYEDSAGTLENKKKIFPEPEVEDGNAIVNYYVNLTSGGEVRFFQGEVPESEFTNSPGTRGGNNNAVSRIHERMNEFEERTNELDAAGSYSSCDVGFPFSDFELGELNNEYGCPETTGERAVGGGKYGELSIAELVYHTEDGSDEFVACVGDYQPNPGAAMYQNDWELEQAFIRHGYDDAVDIDVEDHDGGPSSTPSSGGVSDVTLGAGPGGITVGVGWDEVPKDTTKQKTAFDAIHVDHEWSGFEGSPHVPAVSEALVDGSVGWGDRILRSRPEMTVKNDCWHPWCSTKRLGPSETYYRVY